MHYIIKLLVARYIIARFLAQHPPILRHSINPEIPPLPLFPRNLPNPSNQTTNTVIPFSVNLLSNIVWPTVEDLNSVAPFCISSKLPRLRSLLLRRSHPVSHQRHLRVSYDLFGQVVYREPWSQRRRCAQLNIAMSTCRRVKVHERIKRVRALKRVHWLRVYVCTPT